jgi:hypothetical protein
MCFGHKFKTVDDDFLSFLPIQALNRRDGVMDKNHKILGQCSFGLRAAPYVGAGLAISTGDDADAGLLLIGGLDIPLTSRFTLNGAVNASVTGDPAVGVLLGVGYNF